MPDTLTDENVNTETGEYLTLSDDIVLRDDNPLRDEVYAGISTQPITKEQYAILCADVSDEEIEVRPDGAVYMSHGKYRQRLNDAFLPRGWAMRRLTPYRESKKDRTVYAEWALYIEGIFVDAAVGEQKIEDRSNMTRGDMIEGAKSNALMRCCKGLGMALKLWDRTFADSWREMNCVKVWVQGKEKPQWRLLSAPMFYKERGLADDSPNRDRYVRPSTEARETREPDTRPDRGRAVLESDPILREDANEVRSSMASRRPAVGRTITEGQQRRLFAISREYRLDRDDYQRVLKNAGYDSDSDVTMADYDRVVSLVKSAGSRDDD